MKNVKKMAVLLLSFMVITAFSGCMGGLDEPAESPNDVIGEGFSNLANFESGEYQVKLEGLFTHELIGNGEIDLNTSGIVNAKDEDNMLFSMLLDLESTGAGEKSNVDGEIRIVENMMYLIISDVEAQGVEAFVEPYLGSWYKVEVPEDSEPSLPFSGEETEEQKAIMELMKKTAFFKDVVYEGSDEMGGVESYHYSGVFDNEAFREFILAVGEVYGEGPSSAEMEDIDALLEGFELQGDIWIGESDMTFHAMEGTMKAAMEGQEVELNFFVEIGAINEDLTVVAPSDAKNIEELGLMPMFMGGMGGGMDYGLEDGAYEYDNLDEFNEDFGDVNWDEYDAMMEETDLDTGEMMEEEIQ